MQITIEGTVCRIQREPGEPRCTSESQVLHRLKVALNAQGYSLIKRLMWKDGHMMSDTQHYLRAKNRKDTNGIFAVYDACYAIRNLCTDYNSGRVACLEVTRPD